MFIVRSSPSVAPRSRGRRASGVGPSASGGPRADRSCITGGHPALRRVAPTRAGRSLRSRHTLGAGMNVQTAAAVGSALLSLAFAMSTFERWLARRRPHELMWSIALLMFAIAAGALAAGAGTGWNGPIFRIFIISGAIATVPFLALGTVSLLAGRKRGDVATACVALAVAFAAGVVTVAPFRAPLPHDQLAQASDVFGPLPRIFAGVASGGGALVVVGGALWSVWRI